MKLNLKNPIVFFDLETTGTDIVHDRIVEISYHKVYPNGREEGKTLRINPQMPIPPASTAVHGITDEDVKDCPTFKEVAREIARDIEGCDLAGYNSNRFDVKFVDVQVIFHKMEQRTLAAAYKFYCHKELTDAHTAEADTMATYEVLQAQLDRYPELQNDVDFLAKFTTQSNNADFAGRIVYNERGEEVFNFGKYKGKKVTDVFNTDIGYYGWMMSNDFALHTKKVLTAIKLRNFNK